MSLALRRRDGEGPESIPAMDADDRPRQSPLNLRDMKRNAARAALDFIEPGIVVGVGSGSTVDCFLDLLEESGASIGGAVSASEKTSAHLRRIGIEVLDIGEARPVLYVDGADQIDMYGRALKGRGGALTREKAVAHASAYWACIVDATKVTRVLREGTVVLEVQESMADRIVGSMRAMGGSAQKRSGDLSDSGNPLLDVTGLSLDNPLALEDTLDAIPGVIGNGVFARRRADVILVGRGVGGVGRVIPQGLPPGLG
jgi:ribose 5-phosphate isomerase A